MGVDTGVCGATRRNPLTGKIGDCTLPVGHRTPHHHKEPREFMHWPLVAVACQAWRLTDTAMGAVVVFCAVPAEKHKLGEHEGRMNIYPLRWTDAQISAAGKVAKDIAKLIKALGLSSGDYIPIQKDLARRFRSAEKTTAAACELLVRDGVLAKKGKRWTVC